MLKAIAEDPSELNSISIVDERPLFWILPQLQTSTLCLQCRYVIAQILPYCCKGQDMDWKPEYLPIATSHPYPCSLAFTTIQIFDHLMYAKQRGKAREILSYTGWCDIMIDRHSGAWQRISRSFLYFVYVFCAFFAIVLISLPPLQTLLSGLKTKCIAGQSGQYKSSVSLLSTSQH